MMHYHLSDTKLIFIFTLIFIIGIVDLPAQLITNGGFEDAPLGSVVSEDVPGWLFSVDTNNVTTPTEFEIVDDVVQKGEKALKVLVKAIGSNQWDIQIVADSIPAIPGDQYRFTVWAKAAKAGAQVNFTIGNYSYSEYKALRPANLTTAWKAFSSTFTVTDQETVIRAPIHFGYSGNVDNAIYIDNFSMVNLNERDKPIIVEAESGEVGNDFAITESDALTYISIKNNGTAYFPETGSRMCTYQVSFPDSGTYDLFARIRVGASTFDDDSFFSPDGFGQKDSVNEAHWVMNNGLASGGFADSTAVVREIGSLGSNVWKWVNLSRNHFDGGDTARSFQVTLDSLTQIFQIGGREDGLDIDKLAFGRSNLFYTVGNLNNRSAGTPEAPNSVDIYEGPPLATKHAKFLGNIYSNTQNANFAAYWNQVIPENAGKWGSVEGSRDVMNWSGLDAAYALAKNNGYPFMFHVLVWGNQQPSWISSLDSAEQREEIEEWFNAVAERYSDIDHLQVVNEPLPDHAPAGYKRALGGDGETGYDWIIEAFSLARDIFPASTKLLINDYNIINSVTNTNKYLQIINLLKERNLIDAIGVQGHAFSTKYASVSSLKSNLNSLSGTGLPVYITEMEVDGNDDNAQLAEYKRIFPVLWKHSGVKGITLWGWRHGLWREDEGAFLIETNNEERPALVWLRNYLDTVSVAIDNDIAELPGNYSLSKNYPNPFNPATTIDFSIVHHDKVTLQVYDLLGRKVKTLVNKKMVPGNYSVRMEATELSSGVYFYHLKAGNYQKIRKMILMK